MKSIKATHSHTGITAVEVTTTVGPSALAVTVPAGIRCIKLKGGGWVVDDLAFIEDKRGIMYSDADIYGIRILEAQITAINPSSS